jgi:hypothetical protein
LCGDNVSLVDTSQGNTVDLEGAGDHEKATFELLQEYSPLATEPTGEDDDNGARCQCGAKTWSTVGFAGFLGLRLHFGGVETRSLVYGNKTFAAVLGTANLIMEGNKFSSANGKGQTSKCSVGSTFTVLVAA